MNFTTHVGGHVKDHCVLIGFKNESKVEWQHRF
jgi:hypothetical protein